MTKDDKARLLAVLVRFTDEVEDAHRHTSLDQFFIQRLEVALLAVLEGRVKTIP